MRILRIPQLRRLLALQIASLIVVLFGSRGANGVVTDSSSIEDAGFSNQFVQGGCLYQKVPNWAKIRVCGSDDPQEIIDMGYCRNDDPFDYMEIRISSQNWDSAIYEAWLLQIVLSEILNVPTSLETASSTSSIDFYDVDSRMENQAAYSFDCLVVGFEVGDCRSLVQNEEDYVGCCHFAPEIWEGEQSTYRDLERDGSIEPVVGMGIIGEEHWFIPKFTAQRDPSLQGYLGMSGEENRRKLAERFLRPTTWMEYCSSVSASKCRNDTVATRPPTEEEQQEGGDAHRFFVEEIYMGHFRKTEDNDCSLNNGTTCTGHFFNYPCGWSTYFIPQAHYLEIALKGEGPEVHGGYSYGQLVDAMKAANATKSDIAINWWTPEALYQEFIGTDMELMKVTLPPVTQECKENRVPRETMCSPVVEERLGNELGACGEAPNPLKKGITGSLYGLTYDGSIPSALHSPAHEVLSAFQMSGAEIGELFDYVSAREDPREAVCDWVIDNFSVVQNFVPRTYPRVIRENEGRTLGSPLVAVSFALACTAILGVGLAAAGTYQLRKSAAIRYAQLDFLYMLLMGLGLVSLGALLLSLPSSASGLCGLIVWTTVLGYTFELVPLIVKMAAIARLMSAAERMVRVVVTRRQLFGAALGISFVMVIFLIVWTTVDPPVSIAEYKEDSRWSTTEEGDEDVYVVEYTFYCGSNSEVWKFVEVASHLLLLFIATMQAFLTRNIRKEINESQTLAIMIYSHCIFVGLRLVLLFLDEDTLDRTDLMNVRSIIWSLDCLAALAIYFVPKFLAARAESRAPRSVSSASRVTMTGELDTTRNSVGGGGYFNSPSFRDSLSTSYRTTYQTPDVARESKTVQELRRKVLALSAPPFRSCGLDDSNRHSQTDIDESQRQSTIEETSSSREASGDLTEPASPPGGSFEDSERQST